MREPRVVSEEFDFSTGMPSADMAQYLQLYLDETAEQLDALVESLLVLETQPTDVGQLNEAFRLIHSIKGSSGMMGLDGITVLTHHLENHFERLRSGLSRLDQRSMGLVLRCIDFLRECNRRLRAGEGLASAPELLDELNALSTAPRTAANAAPEELAAGVTEPGTSVVDETASKPVSQVAAASPASPPVSRPVQDYLVTVRFEAELALADLKGELVVTRLADVSTVRDTLPARSQMESGVELRCLQVLVTSDREPQELRSAADVDGIETIEIQEGVTEFPSLPATGTAGSRAAVRPAESAGDEFSATGARGGSAALTPPSVAQADSAPARALETVVA